MAASVGQFLYTWYPLHPEAAVHKDHSLFSFLGVLWLLPLCECDFIGVMILLPFQSSDFGINRSIFRTAYIIECHVQ